MSRVMLVCPEALGSGQPAGIGIRFVEMAQVLLGERHTVTILSRDGGGIAGCVSRAITPEALRDVSEASDVAVVQGHVANDFFAHARRLPTVIDLYDPFIVENLHYYEERGAEVFAHDHATLLRSLLGGDFFLCASEAQRMFYLGMLLALGRVNPALFGTDPELASLLRIAPFGVQPPRAPKREGAPPAVLFGGIYDWYDPIAAIDAVAAARESVPGMTLTFTHHPNPEATPQGKLGEAIEYARSRRHTFVEFLPWAPYGNRTDLFDRHTVALMTFRQSIETDLSMRTRVYDFLWAGLPVVTSSAPGTDEVLERYGAGVVVRDGRFAPALVELFTDHGKRKRMTEGAARFVAEHQWRETLCPLVNFCRSPHIDATREEFAVSLTPPAPRPASLIDRVKRRIGGLH